MHPIVRLAETWRRGPLALLLAATFALLLLGAACDDDGDAAPAETAPAGASADASTDADTSSDESAAFPQTFEDDSGEHLTFEAAPARIISFSPGATEILFAIGAGDQVVAADQFSDYPQAAADLPKLEYSNPDPEASLAHEADLVIMATRQREQLPQFRDLGMRVIFLNEPADLEGVYEQIALFGRLTDHTGAAATVVADMRTRIDAVTAVVAGQTEHPRVFYELSPDLYTVAPDTFIGSLIALVGGQNIAEGATSAFPQLSAEALLAADPQVVLLSDHTGGENAETVGARPGWGGVSAVIEGRIYPVDPDIINRPGPRLADGIEVIARALYPEQF